MTLWDQWKHLLATTKKDLGEARRVWAEEEMSKAVRAAFPALALVFSLGFLAGTLFWVLVLT